MTLNGPGKVLFRRDNVTSIQLNVPLDRARGWTKRNKLACYRPH